jgi:hypothetical protein
MASSIENSRTGLGQGNKELLAKVEKCITSHLLSPRGEDEGEGDIFRLHPHPNPLPPAGEGE